MRLLFYIWNQKAETKKYICDKLKRYANLALNDNEKIHIDFHKTNDYLK